MHHKPWSNIIWGKLPDFFKTSNEPILKYCVCHTVVFFDFLYKNMFFHFIKPKLISKIHCYSRKKILQFKKAWKTPEYLLITGHQYVTPLHFPIFFFFFFFKRIKDICLPYHVYSILLTLLKSCIVTPITKKTQSKDYLKSNEIVLNYCVCHIVAFFKTFHLKTYFSYLLTHWAQSNDLQLVTCCHMF